MAPDRLSASSDSLSALALEKLTRVLGEAHGRRVFEETLSAMNLTDLKTPEELHAFSEQLTQRGGFEAAVGGLLGVTAVLRGATGRGARG